MSNEIYKSGELVDAFPLAKPSKMKRVGLLLEMTCRRDGDSGGNEWSVYISDGEGGEVWSLAEFQFRKLTFE